MPIYKAVTGLDWTRLSDVSSCNNQAQLKKCPENET